MSALSGRIKNASGKVITDLRLSVNFDTGDARRKVALPLVYSELIMPDQTVRVAPPAGGATLRAQLARQGRGSTSGAASCGLST